MAEDMTDKQKEDAFTEEYTALAEKHGLKVTSCNCCGLWVAKHTPGDGLWDC